jgi:hypothetical protein
MHTPAPADARHHAVVAARALTQAQQQRHRRAAKMRARGVSEALIERVLGHADDNIAGLEKIVRRDRLAVVDAERRTRPVVVCGMRRHPRTRGAGRPPARRSTSSNNARGSPGDDPDLLEPLRAAHSAPTGARSERGRR